MKEEIKRSALYVLEFSQDDYLQDSGKTRQSLGQMMRRIGQ
jgi:hypothetical protein